MGMEVFLLPAGIALIAAITWTAAFKGLLSRSIKSPQTASLHVGESSQLVAVQSGSSVAEPIHVEETAPTVEPTTTKISANPIAIAPIATASLVEAPSPFEEPQTPFTNPAITSTPMPTDVNAVTNIASPTENAAPSLVIATPKRTRRTKRLPANGAPRRKRAPRSKPALSADPAVIPATEALTTTGQQSEPTQ